MKLLSTLPICCMIIAMTLATASGNAQNSYSFSEHTVPYIPLDETMSTTPLFDANGFFQVSDLNGETFHVYGIPFTFGGMHTLHIGDYGFLRIDNDSSAIIMDGLFTFLESAGPSSIIHYHISGSPGSKELTVEWKDQRLTSGPAGNSASFQISLHQATGIIEVHIGPNTGGSNIFSDPAGPNCGIFYAPDDFTSCYEKLWVEGDPMDLTIDSLPNFGFNVLTGFPAPNTLYRFTPSFLNTSVPEQDDMDRPVITHGENEIWIEVKGASVGSELHVIDPQGRTTSIGRMAHERMRIGTSSLNPGVYILRMTNGGRSASARFIVH